MPSTIQRTKGNLRAPKRILHLTLHYQWFDEIVRGVKKEEYRERKSYWKTRLEKRQYDEVHFRNGYAKDAPFMRVQYRGLGSKRFDGQTFYAIRLGKILELKRWKKS